MNKNDLEQIREQTADAVNKALKVNLREKITEQVVLGFDGFIDKIVSVVRVRQSPSEYELMENISELSSRIAKSAGSSASIEYILKRRSVGGFTCNLGRALSTLCGLNQNVQLIGAYGHPKINDIFQNQLIDKYQCKIFSVTNPGMCDAYEFADGKIMLVNSETLNQLDWNQILSITGRDFLIEKYEESSLWGIGYWASSPHMSEIFSTLQEEILPNLSHSTTEKYLILDLADLMKKPKSQVMDLVTLLPRFEDSARVVLSLNDRELQNLGLALNLKETLNTIDLTIGIQDKLNISLVISHTPKLATIVSDTIQTSILNAYTPAPQYTTSAGDHFNAGIGYGLLQKLPTELLPLLGNGVTSFFVREGRSPNITELREFLSNYQNYLSYSI